MWETWVQSLGGKIPWRREQLPTPVLWPGEFRGLYSPGVAKSRTRLNDCTFFFFFLVTSSKELNLHISGFVFEDDTAWKEAALMFGDYIEALCLSGDLNLSKRQINCFQKFQKRIVGNNLTKKRASVMLVFTVNDCAVYTQYQEK